jgi:hypothetical protein
MNIVMFVNGVEPVKFFPLTLTLSPIGGPIEGEGIEKILGKCGNPS